MNKENEDIKHLESKEIDLEVPFNFITVGTGSNPEDRYEEEATFLTIQAPSIYKKDIIFKLKKKVIKAMVDLQTKVANSKNENNVTEEDSKNENNVMDVKSAKSFATLALCSGCSDDEFEQIKNMTIDLLCTNEMDARNINTKFLPCLINGEYPLRKVHLKHLSYDDYETLVLAYIGFFIAASFMK